MAAASAMGASASCFDPFPRPYPETRPFLRHGVLIKASLQPPSAHKRSVSASGLVSASKMRSTRSRQTTQRLGMRWILLSLQQNRTFLETPSP